MKSANIQRVSAETKKRKYPVVRVIRDEDFNERGRITRPPGWTDAEWWLFATGG
jgi:hypothetical protein